MTKRERMKRISLFYGYIVGRKKVKAEAKKEVEGSIALLFLLYIELIR